MTIWGVGTGRCGTKSLAAALGGQHEGRPYFDERSPRAFHGDAQAADYIRECLRVRHKAKRPSVALQQSLHLPLIREVDSRPDIIWMVRHPVDCVESMLSGNCFLESEGYGSRRWAPSIDGWRTGTSRLAKCVHYWRGVNLILLTEHERRGEPWTILHPHELPTHENRHARHEPLGQADREYVEAICLPVWRDVLAARKPTGETPARKPTGETLHAALNAAREEL